MSYFYGFLPLLGVVFLGVEDGVVAFFCLT